MSGADIAAGVSGIFEDRVPGARFGVQPPNGAVVNVPSAFYVHETPVAFPPHSVHGITVQITPKVGYFWRYEPDTDFVGPTGPGSPRSDEVTHTYRSAGSRQVTLRAVWTATFTVFGRTFDVPGEVVREAALTLGVREAGTDLVS